MANVVFFIVLAAAIAALVLGSKRRSSRPSRRLRRTFKRYRSNLLASVSKPARRETRRLLDSAERYLDGLLRAKEQLVLLGELEEAGQELLGGAPSGPKAPQPLETRLQERLEEFFAQLSRVAAASAFQDDAGLDALRVFGEDLEVQQEALRELAFELGTGRQATRTSSHPAPSARPAPAQAPALEKREDAIEEEEING